MLVAKPNFDRNVIFGENLVATHMKKTRVLYNKPHLSWDVHSRALKNLDV
jgi:hypothetical protein